jgi:hypothetical protein
MSSSEDVTESHMDDMKVFNESLLNFPFEFRIERSIPTIESYADSKTPIIYFTVYGQNWWHMTNTIGYGYLHLPLEAGSYEIVVDTWKPIGSLRQQRSEFFLGVGPTLRENKCCGVPNNDKNVLNRFGWQATKSGRILIRLDIAKLTHQHRNNKTTLNSIPQLVEQLQHSR